MNTPKLLNLIITYFSNIILSKVKTSLLAIHLTQNFRPCTRDVRSRSFETPTPSCSKITESYSNPAPVYVKNQNSNSCFHSCYSKNFCKLCNHNVIQTLSQFSGAATMLLMLLFLIFHSPLACYNVHRFVASSLFSCCPIILYVIYACYSCVDGTEIKDTN